MAQQVRTVIGRSGATRSSSPSRTTPTWWRRRRNIFRNGIGEQDAAFLDHHRDRGQDERLGHGIDAEDRIGLHVAGSVRIAFAEGFEQPTRPLRAIIATAPGSVLGDLALQGTLRTIETVQLSPTFLALRNRGRACSSVILPRPAAMTGRTCWQLNRSFNVAPEFGATANLEELRTWTISRRWKRVRARRRPREDHGARPADQTAFILDGRRQSYADDCLMDRVAAALQCDGVKQREAISVCASTSIEYATLFFGALSIGVVTGAARAVVDAGTARGHGQDCGAKLLFLDASTADSPEERRRRQHDPHFARRSDCGKPFSQWLRPAAPVAAGRRSTPQDPFNIIYSSGDRRAEGHRAVAPDALVACAARDAVQYNRSGGDGAADAALFQHDARFLLPTLAGGGTVALMKKFVRASFSNSHPSSRHARDAGARAISPHHVAAGFRRYDLSSFRIKFCTSAPFAGSLKGDILKRWPGGLIEYYGMTEGGGTCVLVAHEFPRQGRYGRPSLGRPRHQAHRREWRRGRPRRSAKSSVSGTVANGYHNQPGKTRRGAMGRAGRARLHLHRRCQAVRRRTASLKLMDRRWDMIISGGFNIYPSDLGPFSSSIRRCRMRGRRRCRWNGARRRWPSSCSRRVRPAPGLRAIRQFEARQDAAHLEDRDRRRAAAFGDSRELRDLRRKREPPGPIARRIRSDVGQTA